MYLIAVQLPGEPISALGKPAQGSSTGQGLLEGRDSNRGRQVVVGGLDRRCRMGESRAAPEALDPLEELLLELFAEDDVDEDVDRRVEGDQQVGGLGQGLQLDVQDLQNVDDQRKNVAENWNILFRFLH